MEAPNRLVATMMGLVALWVAVYWLWPAEPPVRFAPGVLPSAPPPMLAKVQQSSQAIVPAAPAASNLPTNPTPPAEVATEPRVQPVLVARSTSPDPSAGPRNAVIPPQFREYRVREGDTPASIALQELGDTKLASAVLQANQLMSPAHLRAGRIIRLPLDPKNLQGTPIAINEAGKPQPPDAQPTPAPRSTLALPTPEYIVRKGDSLAAIARRVYGSEALVQLLIDANKDTLTNPSEIRPGQVLRVPPAPAETHARPKPNR